MPNPFSIWEDRFGGTRLGICANKGIVNNSAVHLMLNTVYVELRREPAPPQTTSLKVEADCAGDGARRYVVSSAEGRKEIVQRFLVRSG